ncbi:energy-coupling factor transporter transmembrane protein EcfT [bacterium]|nr:energy-coupling factor transporter transmembrane protein EcfT [bacterium]
MRRKSAAFLRLDAAAWALLPFAVALNVVMGLTASPLPVHLDSLGTCLAAALAGPWAGMIAGAVGNAISALQNPIWLRYFPVAVLIGALVGLLTRCRMMSSAFLAGIAGVLVGIGSACIAAPITAWSGGASGGGTDFIIAAFRQAGYSRMAACFAESLLVDPADKMVSCIAVYFLLAIMPAKMRAAFPNGQLLQKIRLVRMPFISGSSQHESHGERHEVAAGCQKIGLYVPGSSFWHRATPGTKLLLLLCSAISLFFLPGWARIGSAQHLGWYPLPYYPALLSGLFALALCIGVGAELGRLLLATALPLSVAIIAINGIWGYGDTINWNGLSWSISSACQASTIAMGLTLVAESAGLLLLTTSVGDICAYLEHLGLSPRLTYTIQAAMNLIPSMQRRAAEIREAQSARALPAGRGFIRGLRTFLPTLIPLLMSAIADAHEKALTLEARGFAACPSRTRWSTPKVPAYDSSLQLLIALVFLFLAVTAHS